MPALGKLFLNALFEIQIRKDFIEPFKCNSQHWTETEYDDIVLDPWKLTKGKFIVKMKKEDELESDNDLKIHYVLV